jgi:hypothetical protein
MLQNFSSKKKYRQVREKFSMLSLLCLLKFWWLYEGGWGGGVCIYCVKGFDIVRLKFFKFFLSAFYYGVNFTPSNTSLNLHPS